MVTRFNIVDGKPVMDTSGMFVLYSSYDQVRRQLVTKWRHITTGGMKGE